jgi:hypothetical protein
MLRFVALAAGLATVCGSAAIILAVLRLGLTWIALAAGLAVGAVAVSAWLGWRSRRWSESKLCLFRDRLLIVQGRRVWPVLWDRIETATLAAGGALRWVSGGGHVKLGRVLTLVLPGGESVSLRPHDFGLDAGPCRELILHYRDDPAERLRLPEFDSALDLRGRPVQAGELRRSVR